MVDWSSMGTISINISNIIDKTIKLIYYKIFLENK
jgi:hypothetical protein